MNPFISKSTLLVCFILVIIQTEKSVLITSSGQPHSFQISFSLRTDSLFHVYSQTIVDSQSHILNIDTKTNPATITPEIDRNLLLVNAFHQGRHLIEYHQQSAEQSSETEHFHFAEVFYEEGYHSYLLPAFSDKTPALLMDNLYRCSNTLISVDWFDNSAHIVAVSQDTNWRIHQNIDNGHRGKSKGVSYIYAIDQGHQHPIRIDIGEKHFCQITRQTKGLKLQYDFRTKQTYQLKEVLFLSKESLPIQTKSSSGDLDL